MATADQSFQVILDARLADQTRMVACNDGKTYFAGKVIETNPLLTKVQSPYGILLFKTSALSDIVV